LERLVSRTAPEGTRQADGSWRQALAVRAEVVAEDRRMRAYASVATIW
jgi:hypothetical protein